MEGCLFHFCQALWRHIQEWGLTVVYRDDSSGVRWFVKKMMALAFLPPERIENVFNFMIDNKWPVGVDPADPRLRGWIAYLQANWIYNNNFPRALWSVYHRRDNRTNNFLESKHNTFRDIFQQHSTLWGFLARLNNHHITELTTQHVHSYGASPASRSSQQVERENRLNIIKQLYTTNQLNDYEYVKRVASFLKEF